MKYEVTAEVKTTIDADTAQGAMDYVKHSVGAGAVQSITAVEKDDPGERVKRIKSILPALVDSVEAMRETIGMSLVSIVGSAIEVGVGADEFLRTFKSFKIEDADAGSNMRYVYVEFGEVRIYTFASEKQLNKYF